MRNEGEKKSGYEKRNLFVMTIKILSFFKDLSQENH